MRRTVERRDRRTGPARASPGARLTRRRVLAFAAGTVLVGLGTAAAALRAGGYSVPRGRVLAAFPGWQFIVLQAAAGRIVAVDGPGAPTADELDVAGFLDAWVARMSAQVRRDLGRFLAYLEHVAPLGCGLASRFTRLSGAQQDRVLGATEASRNDLVRAGFDGLKSLVFMGYYRDPRTWSTLGYDGPLVGRPSRGWSARQSATGSRGSP